MAAWRRGDYQNRLLSYLLLWAETFVYSLIHTFPENKATHIVCANRIQVSHASHIVSEFFLEVLDTEIDVAFVSSFLRTVDSHLTTSSKALAPLENRHECCLHLDNSTHR